MTEHGIDLGRTPDARRGAGPLRWLSGLRSALQNARAGRAPSALAMRFAAGVLCLCGLASLATGAWAQEDTDPPVLASASTYERGTGIHLVFSEGLDESFIIPAGRFAVTADGSPVAVNIVVSDKKTLN